MSRSHAGTDCGKDPCAHRSVGAAETARRVCPLSSGAGFAMSSASARPRSGVPAHSNPAAAATTVRAGQREAAPHRSPS